MECKSKLDYAIRIDTLLDIAFKVKAERDCQYDRWEATDRSTEGYRHQYVALNNLAYDLDIMILDDVTTQHAIKD